MSVGHILEPAKMAEPIEMLMGADLGGSKEPFIRWGRDPPWEEAILGVVQLIDNHW